jgi:hypothetical protein
MGISSFLEMGLASSIQIIREKSLKERKDVLQYRPNLIPSLACMMQLEANIML